MKSNLFDSPKHLFTHVALEFRQNAGWSSWPSFRFSCYAYQMFMQVSTELFLFYYLVTFPALYDCNEIVWIDQYSTFFFKCRYSLLSWPTFFQLANEMLLTIWPLFCIGSSCLRFLNKMSIKHMLTQQRRIS